MAIAHDLTTDEEIDAALERAKLLPDRPTAISAEYNAQLDVVVLHLQGGRRLILPRKELQGLESATTSQLSQIEVHSGVDIAWPKLDVDHYLPSLLMGRYGSSAWMRNLQLQGMEDKPENSIESVARLQAFHAMEPLLAPFHWVRGQQLLQVHEAQSSAGIVLKFADHCLTIQALPVLDAVQVTAGKSPSLGKNVKERELWTSLIGRPISQMWLAINQLGSMTSVLFAFGDAVSPEIAVTASASSLKVTRLTAPLNEQ